MTTTYKVDAKKISEWRRLFPIGSEKVRAIKEVRGETGMGLKEAKEWVESDYHIPYEGIDYEVVMDEEYSLHRLMDLLSEVADLAVELRKKGVL